MSLYRLFQDENKVQGLTPGTTAPVQAGVSDTDTGTNPELNLTVPWVTDPATSWLDYRCAIEMHLDAGMALHKPLPQGSQPVDTLASAYLTDSNFAASQSQVNLKSQGQFSDTVQRMATSTYRFCLRGFGLRAGYKVPIPGLRTVGGVPAIPAETQFGVNEIVGNLSGIPLWLGRWELWYYVTLPPRSAQTPPPNLALHIDGDTALPSSIGVPQSVIDQNAVPQQIHTLTGGVGKLPGT